MPGRGSGRSSVERLIYLLAVEGLQGVEHKLGFFFLFSYNRFSIARVGAYQSKN
jgi:hypothetical protein